MSTASQYTPSPADSEALSPETYQIRRVALYAFLINLLLAAAKASLAVFSGSLAITAGAIDSATDSFASLAVYGGVRLSSRRSPTFPLGLYKIENLISVVIALFIFFAGYEIVRHILGSGPAAVEVTPLVLLVLAGTTAVTFGFGRYALKVGRRTGSPTLIAEGKHRQVDVLSSLVVFVSALLSYVDIQFSLFGLGIDELAAAVVVLFIAHAGWELLTEGMRVLLDASVEQETLEQARDIIHSEPLVTEIISLVGRNAGRFRFLQTTIRVRTENLTKAHAATERIQNRLQDELDNVERVLIHVEPRRAEHHRVAVPLETRQGRLSHHFGEAGFFAFVQRNRENGAVVEQTVKANPFATVAKGKGIQVAEWLVQEKVDQVLVREDIRHKGPGYVFANAGIDVRTAAAEELEEALIGAENEAAG